MFGTAVGAGEQMILAAQRNGTDSALDGIGIDLDARSRNPKPQRPCRIVEP